MPDQKQGQARRERLRKAAERLYEDSRLRDALTDEEAQQLLSWGYRRLEQAVKHTEEMPEEEAMPIVEGQSEAVRKVVRRVNAIMEQFSQAGEGEIRTSLAQFVETVRQVEERTEEAEETPAPAPETLAEISEALDRETLFQRLMNVIGAGDEAE